jgi:hypothetical protein
MEPRHHGPQRNRQRVGNLLISQLLHVAEHDHFLKLNRNSTQRAEHIVVGQCLRQGRDKGYRVDETILRVVDERRPLAGPPPVASNVLQNRDEPARQFVPGWNR